MKKKTVFLLLQYAIFFGLGFALIYYQYTNLSSQELEELKTSVGHVADRWWLGIPILVIGFLSHFFRALRWKLLLEPLEIRPTITNITGAVFIGYITNLLLPRMGEVAKCTVIANYEKQPADKIIGTIVAERAFDLVCLVIISALTFFVQMDVISKYFIYLLDKTKDKNLPLMIGALLAGGIGFVALLIYIYRKNKSGKVGKFIKGIAEGLNAILAMKKRALFILYTILIWGAYLALIYIGFWALPATENLGVGPALSVLVAGSLGIIATPGGLGAYPQVVQVVLNMLYGIKSSFGLAFGWVSWLAQTIIVVLFGLIAFLVLPIYNKNRNEKAGLDRA